MSRSSVARCKLLTAASSRLNAKGQANLAIAMGTWRWRFCLRMENWSGHQRLRCTKSGRLGNQPFDSMPGLEARLPAEKVISTASTGKLFQWPWSHVKCQRMSKNQMSLQEFAGVLHFGPGLEIQMIQAGTSQLPMHGCRAQSSTL